MLHRLVIFLLLPAVLLLSACDRRVVHIHDRHVHSFDSISQFGAARGDTTLVLLDYHHDCGPDSDAPSSFNWVGKLVLAGLIQNVVWVSGRDLLLPNRNSRMDWLGRSLSGYAPQDAQRIRNAIRLMDWSDLESWQVPLSTVVSLDLDVLVKDPGNPPERFLDELLGWIDEHSIPLVTVAASLAYQTDSTRIWQWLDQLLKHPAIKRGAWFFESADSRLAPESREEIRAWALWQSGKAGFTAGKGAFYPGKGMWYLAPPGSVLAGHGIAAGNEAAGDLVSAWADPDLATLNRLLDRGKLQDWWTAACAALPEGLGIAGARADRNSPAIEPPPLQKDSGLGLALRLVRRGVDRGCLALYDGVVDPLAALRWCALQACADPRYPPVRPEELEDLEVELSFFAPWRPMKDALDFRPGFDSLLLEHSGARTLLQASLSVQRHYDREEFLSHLSAKAGLGKDGWKNPALKFSKAVTVWYKSPWLP